MYRYQLLWAGCDRDIVNKNGDTALHLAAKGGYEDIVWLLCENGAEASYTIKDNDGNGNSVGGGTVVDHSR